MEASRSRMVFQRAGGSSMSWRLGASSRRLERLVFQAVSGAGAGAGAGAGTGTGDG